MKHILSTFLSLFTSPVIPPADQQLAHQMRASNHLRQIQLNKEMDDRFGKMARKAALIIGKSNDPII